MIAVTIGVGEYKAMAEHAAMAVKKMTGLNTVVLCQDQFRTSGLPYPHFLKLRLFDLLDEEDLLFFDADIVCLNKWDPRAFTPNKNIVAVADRQDHPLIKKACMTWRIPRGQYFNTGMLIVNRTFHDEWLKATELFIQSHPLMPLYDQTPLNIVQQNMGLSVTLLDRRYNWIGFGNGSFCYQVPVFMAHTLCSDSKEHNLDFFEGRLQLKLNPQWTINEVETARVRDKSLQVSDGIRTMCIQLGQDGTTGPLESPLGGHHWCIVDGHESPMLIIASETEVVRTFTKLDSGCWKSNEEARHQGSHIIDIVNQLVLTRWFTYHKNNEQRSLELLGGGQVGQGASMDEQFWYVLENDGEPNLILGAERHETCCLKWIPALGGWEGRSLIREQSETRLLPYR